MGYSSAWKDTLDQVKEFYEGSSGNVWYRGVNDSRYSLHSGLFRLNSASLSLSEYLAIEKQLYVYYKNLGHLLHSNDNGWGLLYSMQHHGVKTRLLDWSESLSVALYFACLGWSTQPHARLWILDPMKLNTISLHQPEIVSPVQSKYRYPESFDEAIGSFAVFPYRNNQRILAQHGCFTVQGNSLQPLEHEFEGNLRSEQGIRHVDLPLSVKTDVLEYLHLNGVNHYSMMPDLGGLAQYVNEIIIRPAWRT